MHTSAREPLTTQLVVELLKRLHVAFPRTIGKDNPAATADIYRNGLRGLSGDAVRAAVEEVIRTDQYFPKVSRLREIAAVWDRQRTVELAREPAWDECPQCGARATYEPVMVDRGKKDEHGKAVLEYAGYERLQMRHRRRGHGLADDVREHIA